MQNSKIIIVGAGGAGLVAAIKAKELGASVTVLCKQRPTNSQTCMAQGGINAAINSADSVELHIQDTLKSALGKADSKMVELMCRAAPEAIEWLDKIGVPFSRDSSNTIAQRMLGGASAARACYAQDYTGLKILHTLYDQCLRVGVEFVCEQMLIDLIVEDGICRGVVTLDIRTSSLQQFHSNATILATGGYCGLYGEYSTNASNTTGDGIAVTLRSGAMSDGLEFVQFHPTALKNSSVLISESARGEGGYLLDSNMKRFTDELDARDKVARAIYDKMIDGEDVYLDITHLGEDFIDKHLPQERKLSKLYENIDPVDKPMPIRPVAHYSMGGIQCDNQTQTAITALFVAGECANHKVHGANRLGGNSLLELVVFATIAAENALKAPISQITSDIDLTNNKEFIDSLFNENATINFYHERRLLNSTMYSHVGIKRSKTKLTEALKIVEQMSQRVEQMGVLDTNKTYNTELVEFLEFLNSLYLSRQIIQAALKRESSCGAHYME